MMKHSKALYVEGQFEVYLQLLELQSLNVITNGGRHRPTCILRRRQVAVS